MLSHTCSLQAQKPIECYLWGFVRRILVAQTSVIGKVLLPVGRRQKGTVVYLNTQKRVPFTHPSWEKMMIRNQK